MPSGMRAAFHGTATSSFDVRIPSPRVGDFDTELLEEFLRAFVREAAINLHMRLLTGSNTHHILEAAFKALSRALRRALRPDPERGDALPSTKGVLL